MCILAKNILSISIVLEYLISRVMRAFCATYYATSNIPIESAIQARDLLVIEFTCKSIKKCFFFFIIRFIIPLTSFKLTKR